MRQSKHCWIGYGRKLQWRTSHLSAKDRSIINQERCLITDILIKVLAELCGTTDAILLHSTVDEHRDLSDTIYVVDQLNQDLLFSVVDVTIHHGGARTSSHVIWSGQLELYQMAPVWNKEAATSTKRQTIVVFVPLLLCCNVNGRRIRRDHDIAHEFMSTLDYSVTKALIRLA